MLSDLFESLDAREDFLRRRAESEREAETPEETPQPKPTGVYSRLTERHDPENLRHLSKEEQT